ncbi:hypothetical protein PLICRDRAFT_37248 [Plicaturopsis crispa FD-325 SS-3]|nr:hypothetical protein PLICRDRAFT_37248 [Plicaturopsis crispa FD-325 SS-3]
MGVCFVHLRVVCASVMTFFRVSRTIASGWTLSCLGDSHQRLTHPLTQPATHHRYHLVVSCAPPCNPAIALCHIFPASPASQMRSNECCSRSMSD